MKRVIVVLRLLALGLSLFSQSAQDIVEKADSIFKVNRTYTEATMIVYQSGRAQPSQKTIGFSMEKNGRYHSLSIYREPRRMAGTANLMIENDLWVKFGSTGRVRKLSSSAKKNSAGGTDFSYADMGDGNKGIATDYRPRLLGEEVLDGKDCWKIELLDSGDANYEKLIVFVEKANHRYLRIDYYENGANIKSLSLDDYRKVGSVEYPFHMVMTNHTKPSYTEVFTDVFEVDSPRVEERFFTTTYLESIKRGG